ncbi:MAG TPA: hypothetical protein DC001_06935 [Clostridiales bacterium]|nr:hypothetical protein [Clostridiales bacterium]HBR07576.1 hypothetical protein [Clostridiales bacterium]
MSIAEPLFIGTVGAILYGLIEILWRGHTHWTMLLLGGACFMVMYLIASLDSWPIAQKWLCCAAVITTLEFITGVIVNIRLGWNVWDYSNLPLNLYGQICLLYSTFWFLLSIPGTALCRLIKERIF